MMSCVWSQAHAQYTVTLDPSVNRSTWDGFGAGLSWWAQAVGGNRYQSTDTDLFFDMAPVLPNGVLVPGLGKNLCATTSAAACQLTTSAATRSATRRAALG